MDKKAYRRKKLVSAAVIGAILGSSMVSAIGWSAGLSESLNDMLVATGAPQIAQSQQAMVLQGGYAAVRIPNQSYNVVSFSPPNLSMGCGGINLFLGSFSFINATQFVDMLKQIGEGLAVVAFQTALSTMCAHCMDILNYLQQAMEDMNNAMRGYCSASEGFSISNFTSSMEKAGSAFTNLWNAATGNGSGYTSAVAGESTQPGSGFQNLLSNEENATVKYFGEPHQTCQWVNSGSGMVRSCSTTPASSSSSSQSIHDASLLKDMGNFTWRSMLNSNAEELLNGVSANNELAMEMVMSIAGTTISLPPATGQLGTQAAKGKATDYEASVTLSDLQAGSGVGEEMWVCQPDVLTINGTQYNFPQYGLSGKAYSNLSCLSMGKESLQVAGFVPIDSYVKMMIEGPNAQDESYYATYHSGLINALETNTATGSQLSAAEENFINEMPWPVFGLMQQAMDTGGPNGVTEMTDIATEFEKPLEAEIDQKYLLALQNVLANIQGTTNKVPAPKNLPAVMANINRDLHADQKEINEGNRLYLQAVKEIDLMKNKKPYYGKS